MMPKNIAVLFGGQSNEYEVSLQSAAAVIDRIDRSRYRPILIGITRSGQWLKFSGSTDAIRNDSWHVHPDNVPAILSPCRRNGGLILLQEGECSRIPIDAAFPVLHGKNGEDGRMQGLFELAGIPFVGCGMLSSAVCMDKDIAHKLVEFAGVKVPRSLTVMRGSDDDVRTELVSGGFRLPLYIKPAKSGSSIGITRITRLDELEQALAHALLHDDKAVIEEAVEGFEVGCALLGNDVPVMGEVDEIELSGGFFDFDEKYSLASSTIHTPARIGPETADRVKQTAKRIYNALGCRGMARVDMFLTPAGEIVFNEVNTIPGFTGSSRYAKMLSAVGMTYADVVNRLIGLALEDAFRKERVSG